MAGLGSASGGSANIYQANSLSSLERSDRGAVVTSGSGAVIRVAGQDNTRRPPWLRSSRCANDISEAEWARRVDLAAAFRLVDLYGWSDLLGTHLSARVPDAPDQFLINPFGMLFEEITASCLVKVDEQGNELSPSEFGINPAGFTIHSAVHIGTSGGRLRDPHPLRRPAARSRPRTEGCCR